MQAARNSARSNAFIEALWYLERAFHPNADRSEAEQRSALRLQGDCYAASGRSSEAIAVYQQLASNSESEQESHLLDCLMGEQWIAQGDLGRGFACLRGALKEFGVLSEHRKSWVSTLRLWMDGLHLSPEPRQVKSPTYEPFNMTECCLNRLGTALVFLDIGLGARLVMALAQASADRGSEADRAIALLRWGAVLALGNRRTRAKSGKWIRSGRRLARASDNANAVALGQLCTFVWLFAHSRFKARCAAWTYVAHTLSLRGADASMGVRVCSMDAARTALVRLSYC